MLPHTPKPANLPKDTFWRSAKRASIPRAVWLPNVGYGQIADSTAQYFKTGLFHITGGDRTFAIVFFCKRDCWMSWNAAKRAMEYGYETVFGTAKAPMDGTRLPCQRPWPTPLNLSFSPTELPATHFTTCILHETNDRDASRIRRRSFLGLKKVGSK